MIERVSNTYNILHITFLVICIAIVVLKEINTQWFTKFLKLAWSADYLKLISSTPKRDKNFTGLLLFISSVIMAISYQLYSESLQQHQIQFNLQTSAIVLVLLLFFLFIKFLFQKFIGFIFNIQRLIDDFLDLKYSFYYYSGFLMLIPLLLLSYTQLNQFTIGLIYFMIASFFVIKISLFLIKIRSLITQHLFYFILYICTLEIIPILFIIRYLK
jgi:hypothetical protein